MSQAGETPAATRSTRPRPADRRSEIIAAAIQVIARDGIRACTISALEHATGFARGHFTYHFDAKEEIIGLAFATVGSDWAKLEMQIPAEGPASARLEHHVRAAVEWALARPDYFRCLMNFRVEMMRNPSAFPPSSAIRHQLWDFTSQLIRDGIAEGTFAPPLDPVVEGRLLFAMVDGLLMHSALDPEFCPPGELADRAWNVVMHRLSAGRPQPR
jgi:AcrR family transcriptional regulator